jgi:hypothetical protein
LGDSGASSNPKTGLYTYLKNVLTRFPEMTNQEVGQLTPLNWQNDSQAQVKLAA